MRMQQKSTYQKLYRSRFSGKIIFKWQMWKERDSDSKTTAWQDFYCGNSSSKETPGNNFFWQKIRILKAFVWFNTPTLVEWIYHGLNPKETPRTLSHSAGNRLLGLCSLQKGNLSPAPDVIRIIDERFSQCANFGAPVVRDQETHPMARHRSPCNPL